MSDNLDTRVITAIQMIWREDSTWISPINPYFFFKKDTIPIINSTADNHYNYNLCQRDQNQEEKWNYSISLSVTGRNQINVLRVRQKRSDKSERKWVWDTQQRSPGTAPGSLQEHVLFSLGGNGDTRNESRAPPRATDLLVSEKQRSTSVFPAKNSRVWAMRWRNHSYETHGEGNNAWTSFHKGDSPGSLWITKRLKQNNFLLQEQYSSCSVNTVFISPTSGGEVILKCYARTGRCVLHISI